MTILLYVIIDSMPSKKRLHRKRCDEGSSSDEEEQFDPIKSPAKQMKCSNVDMIDNHIYFRTEVTIDTIGELVGLITRYNEIVMNIQSGVCVVTVLPLYIHITSYGGDLFGGFLGYDYIKNSRIPIYTVVEGYAYSSASILFMAGRKRLMTKNSYILAHQLSQTATGHSKYVELIDDAKNVTEMMTRIYHIYLDNLRYNREKVDQKDVLTKENLEDHMLHDRTWNYDECIKYGLADGEYINSITAGNSDKADILKNVGSATENQYVPTERKGVVVPSKTIINKIIALNKKHANDQQKEAQQFLEQLGKCVGTKKPRGKKT